MNIELTSKDAVWHQTGDGVNTAIVERGHETWQTLLNIRVRNDDGSLIDEYTVAVSKRGGVAMEKTDRSPLPSR
jgi:hypothetical protein